MVLSCLSVFSLFCCSSLCRLLMCIVLLSVVLVMCLSYAFVYLLLCGSCDSLIVACGVPDMLCALIQICLDSCVLHVFV